jgi:dipeptidyl aminopeptidase/acylaminoacyl peptidase
MRPLDLSPEASWRQRFTAPVINWSMIAPRDPARGIVWTDREGTAQWYAWDVPSGALRRLTDTPGGDANFSLLAPDGRHVYFLHDEGGNEIGHYSRMPYEGGPREDLTPDLPPYSSFDFKLSRDGSCFVFDLERQIWGNLGHWELEDMVAACTWLIEQGIARPDAFLLTGWSYGGFLTLFGLGRRPELWAGGIAGIAVADWAMMYEDSAETLRHQELMLHFAYRVLG